MTPEPSWPESRKSVESTAIVFVGRLVLREVCSCNEVVEKGGFTSPPEVWRLTSARKRDPARSFLFKGDVPRTSLPSKTWLFLDFIFYSFFPSHKSS